jgi:hypothetical protein
MHVFSGSNIRNDFSDILTVFDDGISYLEIVERNLMPEGNGLAGPDVQPMAIVQGHSCNDLTWLDIHDGNADVIASIVN